MRLNFLGGNLIRPGNLFIDCADNDEAKPKKIRIVGASFKNFIFSYPIHLHNIIKFLTTTEIMERI